MSDEFVILVASPTDLVLRKFTVPQTFYAPQTIRAMAYNLPGNSACQTLTRETAVAVAQRLRDLAYHIERLYEIQPGVASGRRRRR